MPAMYDASVPTITRALTNLIGILDKGAAHAEARKIEPAVLVGSRLYPDMFPLAKQVQIAADVAKLGTARLEGLLIPQALKGERDQIGIVRRELEAAPIV